MTESHIVYPGGMKGYFWAIKTAREVFQKVTVFKLSLKGWEGRRATRQQRQDDQRHGGGK